MLISNYSNANNPVVGLFNHESLLVNSGRFSCLNNLQDFYTKFISCGDVAYSPGNQQTLILTTAVSSIMTQIYPVTSEPRVKECLDWWNDVRTEIQANEKYVPKYPPVEEIPF